MAKLIVDLPQGWDNKLIVDSKDFATLCDIFERAVGFSTEYHAGTYYRVHKELLLTGHMHDAIKPITPEEFEEIRTTQKAEESV